MTGNEIEGELEAAAPARTGQLHVPSGFKINFWGPPLAKKVLRFTLTPGPAAGGGPAPICGTVRHTGNGVLW